MIEITMTREETLRLKTLLQEIRGNQSMRQFCSTTPIHYAAWRAWEALESAPTLDSLDAIAKLKGWTLDDISNYLRTGDSPSEIKKSRSVGEIMKYIQDLSKEQQFQLIQLLLEQIKTT